LKRIGGGWTTTLSSILSPTTKPFDPRDLLERKEAGGLTGPFDILFFHHGFTYMFLRLKAKRVAKGKTRQGERQIEPGAIAVPNARTTSARPAKRARIDTNETTSASLDRPQPCGRPPTQIISSLFSYNPKVDKPTPNATSAITSAPSNAPLGDSSTFSGLGLDPLIVEHLSSKMNISKPTSIQRAALPVLLSSSDEASSRDVFIQSQTGSGKTLSFLLPIIQDLLPLSSHSYIDRSIGTLAIIIAPTRELAKQISDVLEILLKLRLRPKDESADEPNVSTRLTRWLVSGLLTGGATRTHEKARLRKGLPILVSTPGRLLDHLQNTSSFNVGKCRWLVLDEADRLMELGFEETITGIIQGLDGRRKLALQAAQEGSVVIGGWDWMRRRRSVLCSATIREDVQKLAGVALIQPMMIKATVIEKPSKDAHGVQSNDVLALSSTSEKFTPPSQLAQKYVVAPLKLRPVTLVALLRFLLSQSRGRRGYKIIVFFSCTDSVDFHWQLLGGSVMDNDEPNSFSEDEVVPPSGHIYFSSTRLPSYSHPSRITPGFLGGAVVKISEESLHFLHFAMYICCFPWSRFALSPRSGTI
jgi:ATP-dependent RNA helicase DDX31/DBP7